MACGFGKGEGCFAGRLLGSLAIFAGLALAVFGALIWFDEHTPVLRQGDTVTKTMSESGYAVVGWSRDSDGRLFTFDCEVGTDVEPLAIAVANVSDFRLFCNGQQIFQRGDQPTARLAVATLPRDAAVLRLVVEFDYPETVVRAQIGAAASLGLAEESGRLLFAFCLGMLVLIFAYCFILWVQKPDEIVLLYMMALVLLIVARDITQPFPLVPQSIPTGLKPALNLALVSCMALLSAEYVFPERFKRHPWTRAVFALFVVASVIACYATMGGMFPALYNVLNIVYHGLCVGAVACGCARRIRWCWAMGAGLAFAVGFFSFYTAADMGMVPPGFPAVQGYIIQFYNLPFLVACMAAINGRFVGYYRELARLNAELDDVVEQRTRQIKQQEEQKQQLMINVFHDLRTPLFISKNCVERLRHGGDEELGPQQLMDALDDRLDFMHNLTGDLFTMAKLETGDLFLNEDTVDLSRCCRRQEASFRVQAATKGVALRCNVADGCRVWGDEHRIDQVLQNLLSNAVDHTDAGGSITFALAVVDGGFEVRVSNDGRPIGPSDAKRIFDRYYHVSKGGSNESSGLGLAIAREVMRAHHGSIALEADGRGRPTFVAFFPKLPE